MKYWRDFKSGSFFSIFAPPFVSGERLNLQHYIRFYLGFLVYYLGLPLALLLHLFGVYHIRFYAVDVAFLVTGLFSDKVRKAAHLVLICENPDSGFLSLNNYTGMFYPTGRPFFGSRGAVGNSAVSRYLSLFHCMLDLAQRFTTLKGELNAAGDDKALALVLARNYVRSNANYNPNCQKPNDCYDTAYCRGLDSFPPVGTDFSKSTTLLFACLGLGFFLFWYLFDPRSFERTTGFRLSRYLGSFRGIKLPRVLR
jgi:hypothetical protein